MKRNNLRARISLNVFVCVLSAVVMIDPAIAGTEEAENAEVVCVQELIEKRSASQTRETKVRRRNAIRYVSGIANFDDIGDIRFRCRVYREKVISLTYRVKDPNFVDGTRWVEERPRGAGSRGVASDEDANWVPPIEPASPHFERAPY